MDREPLSPAAPPPTAPTTVAPTAQRPGQPAPALVGLALMLGCQLAGELLARATGAPWPGPVLGLLFVVGLLAIGVARTALAAAAEVLLAHLSLLFVPVGVGVITHLDELARHGLALTVILLLSTWVGLAVTALVLRALWRE